MASFQVTEYALTGEHTKGSGSPELDDKMLLSNVFWFIRVRWIVIAVFLVSGISGKLFSNMFADLGFTIPFLPLLLMSGFLLLMNTGFFIFSRKLSYAKHQSIAVNLWIQIVLDLIFVTNLVYFIGSTNTFIPFIYLIHITLSCIFFPKSRSIVIVCAAALFYLSCVILQTMDFLKHRTVFVFASDSWSPNPAVRLLFALSAVLIWFILWYFISTLSDAVREKDSSLLMANLELKRAEKETNRRVLITTHDLKAPFAGIETNISVLKYIHWDELPDSCRKIIDKIDIRSKTLRERIRQILVLGNLRSRADNEILIGSVNLKSLFDEVLGEIADQIIARKIELITDIKEITVQSSGDDLKALFANLCSNAVYYTPEQGRIEIKMDVRKNDVVIIISDTGIGIDEKYIDKIFDEYFRTPEGRAFNKMSTGLGLQIVKTIAERLGLSLTVESEKDAGTTFTVGIKL